MEVATICMFAMRNAEEKANMRHPQVVGRLVDRLVESEKHVLRLLAIVPGVDISFDVAAKDERISLDDAFEDDMAVQKEVTPQHWRERDVVTSIRFLR